MSEGFKQTQTERCVVYCVSDIRVIHMAPSAGSLCFPPTADFHPCSPHGSVRDTIPRGKTMAPWWEWCWVPGWPVHSQPGFLWQGLCQLLGSPSTLGTCGSGFCATGEGQQVPRHSWEHPSHLCLCFNGCGKPGWCTCQGTMHKPNSDSFPTSGAISTSAFCCSTSLRAQPQG